MCISKTWKLYAIKAFIKVQTLFQKRQSRESTAADCNSIMNKVLDALEQKWKPQKLKQILVGQRVTNIKNWFLLSTLLTWKSVLR